MPNVVAVKYITCLLYTSGRFQIFHVKDHREIGQSGMVGFDAIFKNAKTAGVNYLVAEIEKYSVCLLYTSGIAALCN